MACKSLLLSFHYVVIELSLFITRLDYEGFQVSLIFRFLLLFLLYLCFLIVFSTAFILLSSLYSDEGILEFTHKSFRIVLRLIHRFARVEELHC